MLEVFAIVQCMTFTNPKYNSCVVDYQLGTFANAATCQARIDVMADWSQHVDPSITRYCASKTVQTWKKVN